MIVLVNVFVSCFFVLVFEDLFDDICVCIVVV